MSEQQEHEIARLQQQIVRVLKLFELPSTNVGHMYLDAIGDVIQEHMGMSWMELRGIVKSFGIDYESRPPMINCRCTLQDEYISEGLNEFWGQLWNDNYGEEQRRDE